MDVHMEVIKLESALVDLRSELESGGINTPEKHERLLNIVHRALDSDDDCTGYNV